MLGCEAHGVLLRSSSGSLNATTREGLVLVSSGFSEYCFTRPQRSCVTEDSSVGVNWASVQVNDGNPPSALPLPISPDLEEPALLPNSAQGLGDHGQLPPMGPAPPSNLTPSLAPGGQPYSAAQQVLKSACPDGTSVPCCLVPSILHMCRNSDPGLSRFPASLERATSSSWALNIFLLIDDFLPT